MNKKNEEKENPKKTQLVTKENIRKYLRLYPTLETRIRQQELFHIKFSPSLDEWKQNINTIECQVISMEEDQELQEMRFYKQTLDRHLYLMKVSYKTKCYNYLLWNYMKNLPKKEIMTRLNLASEEAVDKFDNLVIDYLYLHIKREAESHE